MLIAETTWPATPEGNTLDSAQTDALIKRLARPAPATVAFKEVRFSSLLRKPLIVSGELGYSGPEVLDRRVTAPYREHTSIRGESVSVERDGEPVRSFALKRAPELRGLLQGFSALLAGDAISLRKNFTIEAQTHAHGWTISMAPVDPRARRRVKQLQAVGHDAEPRCFTLTTADNGTSVMLLGATAGESIAETITADQLNALCAKITN